MSQTDIATVRETIVPMPDSGGILGVDPGLTGALALHRGRQWVLLDMPVIGTGTKRQINAAVLFAFLCENKPDHAFVEYASTRPGQGRASGFRYGDAYGQVKAVLACAEVPYTIVTPQVWKKHAGLHGPDKEQSRQRALQLFPDQQANLASKLDHARAEAMMISHYGVERQRST
jgi:crossover junction endodeoxyribonuclease RuvC